MKTILVGIISMFMFSCSPDRTGVRTDPDLENPMWYYLSVGESTKDFESDTPRFSGGEWGAEVEIMLNGTSIDKVERGFSLLPLDEILPANSLELRATRPIKVDIYMTFSRLVQQDDKYINKVLWRKRIDGNSWHVRKYRFNLKQIEEID